MLGIKISAQESWDSGCSSIHSTVFILHHFCKVYLFGLGFFFFKLYIIVLVLPNIKMNPPQVYMCSGLFFLNTEIEFTFHLRLLYGRKDLTFWRASVRLCVLAESFGTALNFLRQLRCGEVGQPGWTSSCKPPSHTAPLCFRCGL